ncbi:hypothetical protein [Paraburkholderia sp. JHI869]|uniref:hypothetical protein n=1 Tax=Paraburkholderia sp. JHI869 TaxID=3112959 RepID=UPI00316D53C5
MTTAITGFAPQEWIARFVHHVPAPADVRRLLPLALDARVAIVFIGIAIIVWDVLYRSRRPDTAYTRAGVPLADSQRSLGDWHASGAPRLSIVVLPFANAGGDPEQGYFVDSVTESLTTDLSRILIVMRSLAMWARFHGWFGLSRNVIRGCTYSPSM